jgi:hypothetical protein
VSVSQRLRNSLRTQLLTLFPTCLYYPRPRNAGSGGPTGPPSADLAAGTGQARGAIGEERDRPLLLASRQPGCALLSIAVPNRLDFSDPLRRMVLVIRACR